MTALPINVNPSGGFNCYFPMPFRKHARMTIEYRSVEDCPHFFYAINYALGPVGEEEEYFHSQFRRGLAYKMPSRAATRSFEIGS